MMQHYGLVSWQIFIVNSRSSLLGFGTEERRVIFPQWPALLFAGVADKLSRSLNSDASIYVDYPSPSRMVGKVSSGNVCAAKRIMAATEKSVSLDRLVLLHRPIQNGEGFVYEAFAAFGKQVH
jgi:hypothetical protein